ncbi:hypothetical protein CFC21_015115 [Triticum aestivum]|uniref:Uncharacterized protein n=3 Tax=Triticum TaxID=4564 RepID=A0A9R1NIK1_TRITD|nr:hypothetical protein CFC21_015115 [Triticum aestivum]VAH25669.1 unnamed protein product [Triticum turgidum subsp. durum]
MLPTNPTKEAARAAALARSWRHKFAHVHAISFVEHVARYGPSEDDYTFFVDSVERRSKNGPLLDNINAALLCAGDRNAAPRAFRVQFGCYDNWDKAMVSQWLTHLLRRTPPELHLDLRLQITVIGEHQVGARDRADHGCTAHSPYDADPFMLPARLFSPASPYGRSASAAALWIRRRSPACLSSRRCS